MGNEEGETGGSDNAEAEVEEEGEEDLFGDDEVQVVEDKTKPETTIDGGEVDPMTQSKTEEEQARSGRAGWMVEDYVRFMETGKEPGTQ